VSFQKTKVGRTKKKFPTKTVKSGVHDSVFGRLHVQPKVVPDIANKREETKVNQFLSKPVRAKRLNKGQDYASWLSMFNQTVYMCVCELCLVRKKCTDSTGERKKETHIQYRRKEFVA
jgi:hypothetical protein